MFRDYYNMMKPGIIRGNLITAAAGFLLASKGSVDWLLFIYTLIGISLVIASACVFNNYLDKNIDRLMSRTKNRALAKASIKGREALMFGMVLGLVGFTVLATFTNKVTFLLGAIGVIVYVVLYGISKRGSVHGTLVGSISGAMPIAAGYTAVTSRFDTLALILFLILVFWQMPHFYAIAMYRINDYNAAKIPVLPIVKGLQQTKIQINAYIVAFFLAITFLYVSGYVGVIYQVVMTLTTAFWLWFGLSGFKIKKAKENIRWAGKMFQYSLGVLTIFSLLIAFDNFLP